MILSKLSPSIKFGFFSIHQNFNYDNVNFWLPPLFLEKVKKSLRHHSRYIFRYHNCYLCYKRKNSKYILRYNYSRAQAYTCNTQLVNTFEPVSGFIWKGGSVFLKLENYYVNLQFFIKHQLEEQNKGMVNKQFKNMESVQREKHTLIHL